MGQLPRCCNPSIGRLDGAVGVHEVGHLIDRIGLTHKAGGFFRPRKLKAKLIFFASGKVFLAFANYKLSAVKEASLVKN